MVMTMPLARLLVCWFIYGRGRALARALSMNELVNLEFQNSSHRLILFIMQSVSSVAAAAVAASRCRVDVGTLASMISLVRINICVCTIYNECTFLQSTFFLFIIVIVVIMCLLLFVITHLFCTVQNTSIFTCRVCGVVCRNTLTFNTFGMRCILDSMKFPLARMHCTHSHVFFIWLWCSSAISRVWCLRLVYDKIPYRVFQSHINKP